MNDLAIRLFFVMFALAAIWLGLVAYLMHSLKQHHPAMYESLGSPRGFEARTTQALFTFLLSRKPESLGDSGIRSLANFMRALLPVYLAGFICLVVLITRSQGAA
jgi:disulfide bond formation protein DsbB